jgi:ClpP class serine protease
MTALADLLWRVNNEYRKRLTQAQTFLALLEQMLQAQDSDPLLLDALSHTYEQITTMAAEHRDWRYRYYYEDAESKRMVQDERTIQQALARFSRMRTRHETQLYDLHRLIFERSRPDPRSTRVPTGDLWDMGEYALYDLISFEEYLEKLGTPG